MSVDPGNLLQLHRHSHPFQHNMPQVQDRYTMIYIYICSPPPPRSNLLFASICLPKVLPESFLHNLKEKQKKQKKTRNNQKKNKKKKHTKKNKTLREMSQPEFPQSLCFLCFFWFFGLFGLRLLRAYYWKKHFPLPAFGKRFFPKYFRQFILNFFLWRPDFSKGSSLLSLKTGLFQREVASREESSIWTNRLCVKQDFVKRKKGIIWTELVKWGLSSKKKMLLRKKVDYQEGCFLRRIHFELFFNERTT